MSDSSRDSGGINEDPQPESEGASRQQDSDGAASRDGQTDADGRCEGQGCSELPEGCDSQPLSQTDVGVSNRACTEGSGGPQGPTPSPWPNNLPANNAEPQGASGDVKVSDNEANIAGGSIDVISANRSEGNVVNVTDPQEGNTDAASDRPEGNVDGFSDSPEGDFDAVISSPEGIGEAIGNIPETNADEVIGQGGNVHELGERPEGCVDNLQAIGPEETEDSVEGLYGEGSLVVVSDSSSNAESMAHLGSAEAERTEDDIYGEFSNMESVSDVQGDRECAEADNGTGNWTQELEYSDSAVYGLGVEDLPAASPVEANNIAVESDSQGAVNVNQEENETLSESDPEENACDVNLCNDRAEADSSHQDFLSGGRPRAPHRDSSLNEGSESEADSTEASCATSQSERAEPSLQAEVRDESVPQPPNCAGESVGQDGVFSNLNSSPLRTVASSSAEDDRLRTEASARSPPPPLGDICHTPGTQESGEPGDEPEDSSVSRPDQPQLQVASSETDLYAPECDRGQASALQPLQNAPVVAVEDEVAPVEGEASEAPPDVNLTGDSDAAVSLPPCQQAAFDINDVDLRADQLCSGISGSDLGEDFLRSADMLQSLTENRPTSSDINDEADIAAGREEQVSENRNETTGSFLSLSQNEVPAHASASDTNMQQLPPLQASTHEACALQESKLTNDCIPHSTRDLYSEHSNNSSVESLSSWMQTESETSHVNRQAESLQGSRVSGCVRVEAGDDDLLTELDAELESELESNTVSEDALVKNGDSGAEENIVSRERTEPINGLKALPAVAICELSEEKLRQLFGEMQHQMSKKDSIITQ